MVFLLALAIGFSASKLHIRLALRPRREWLDRRHPDDQLGVALDHGRRFQKQLADTQRQLVAVKGQRAKFGVPCAKRESSAGGVGEDEIGCELDDRSSDPRFRSASTARKHGSNASSFLTPSPMLASLSADGHRCACSHRQSSRFNALFGPNGPHSN